MMMDKLIDSMRSRKENGKDIGPDDGYEMPDIKQIINQLGNVKNLDKDEIVAKLTQLQ